MVWLILMTIISFGVSCISLYMSYLSFEFAEKLADALAKEMENLRLRIVDLEGRQK